MTTGAASRQIGYKEEIRPAGVLSEAAYGARCGSARVRFCGGEEAGTFCSGRENGDWKDTSHSANRKKEKKGEREGKARSRSTSSSTSTSIAKVAGVLFDLGAVGEEKGPPGAIRRHLGVMTCILHTGEHRLACPADSLERDDLRCF